MTTDTRLLSELNELRDTHVFEWLKERQQVAAVGMANAPDDRTAALQAGRYRELADIIKEIEGAKEEFEKQRRSKADMRKSF